MFAKAAAQATAVDAWAPTSALRRPCRRPRRTSTAGFFGKIYAARTVWQRRSGIPGYGSWFTNMDLAGGGALLDIGIHALDRALYLMDYPQPASVSGATFAELGPRGQGLGGWGSDISKPTAGARFDVDDLAWAFVRFANGAVLQFQVAWATNFPETWSPRSSAPKAAPKSACGTRWNSTRCSTARK